MANSPRPGNWILERSLDGENFMPWQYYAISDTECLTQYNITPRLGPPTYKKDDEVICTSYYSRIEPMEHGEVGIHCLALVGLPGSSRQKRELKNYEMKLHCLCSHLVSVSWPFAFQSMLFEIFLFSFQSTALSKLTQQGYACNDG